MILSIHLKMGVSDVLRNTCPPPQNGIMAPWEDLTRACQLHLFTLFQCLLSFSVSSLATILRSHLKSKCFVVYFGICHWIFSLSFPFSFLTYLLLPVWDWGGVAQGVVSSGGRPKVCVTTSSLTNSVASGKFTLPVCASVSTSVKQEYNNAESTEPTIPNTIP